MKPSVVVVGAGPAGLSAAEVLAEAGWKVTVLEALASPGRKLLRAGVGGLNLTHSQDFEAFLSAYGPHRPRLEPFLKPFGPHELTIWAEELGIPLFTGTSGKVFPLGMGAGPLLKAWLTRLESQGVTLQTSSPWLGWRPGEADAKADALVLALGGPTWPALGTGGTWTDATDAWGVGRSPWKPANCGFRVEWTPVFRQKFSGQPLKETVLTVQGPEGRWSRKGELMITDLGLEGGLIYAAGATLRAAGEKGAPVTIHLDLVPGRDRMRVERDLSQPRGARSLSTHLQKTLGLAGVKVGLLREVLKPGHPDDPSQVADLLKALPLNLAGPGPLEDAISAAGGILWDELTPELALKKAPGVWCAGEMLDWEAPTGGYLLTACFSLGRAAGRAVAQSR